MPHTTQRIAALIAVSALALGLAACNKADDNQTAGQKLDQTIEKTEKAADNARMEADRAAEAAGQKIDNAIETSREAAANAAEATKDAAHNAMVAAGAAGMTAKVNAALVGDPELSALKINVDTVGTEVTLHGDAPNQAAKDRATDIAKAVEGVTAVNNQLMVK